MYRLPLTSRFTDTRSFTSQPTAKLLSTCNNGNGYIITGPSSDDINASDVVTVTLKNEYMNMTTELVGYILQEVTKLMKPTSTMRQPSMNDLRDIVILVMQNIDTFIRGIIHQNCAAVKDYEYSRLLFWGDVASAMKYNLHTHDYKSTLTLRHYNVTGAPTMEQQLILERAKNGYVTYPTVAKFDTSGMMYKNDGTTITTSRLIYWVTDRIRTGILTRTICYHLYDTFNVPHYRDYTLSYLIDCCRRQIKSFIRISTNNKDMPVQRGIYMPVILNYSNDADFETLRTLYAFSVIGVTFYDENVIPNNDDDFIALAHEYVDSYPEILDQVANDDEPFASIPIPEWFEMACDVDRDAWNAPYYVVETRTEFSVLAEQERLVSYETNGPVISWCSGDLIRAEEAGITISQISPIYHNISIANEERYLGLSSNGIAEKDGAGHERDLDFLQEYHAAYSEKSEIKRMMKNVLDPATLIDSRTIAYSKTMSDTLYYFTNVYCYYGTPGMTILTGQDNEPYISELSTSNKIRTKWNNSTWKLTMITAHALTILAPTTGLFLTQLTTKKTFVFLGATNEPMIDIIHDMSGNWKAYGIGAAASEKNYVGIIQNINLVGSPTVIVSDMNYALTGTRTMMAWVLNYYDFVSGCLTKLASYDPDVIIFKLQYPLSIMVRLLDLEGLNGVYNMTFVKIAGSPILSNEVFFVGIKGAGETTTANAYYGMLELIGYYSVDYDYIELDPELSGGQTISISVPPSLAKYAISTVASRCSTTMAGYEVTDDKDRSTYTVRGVESVSRLAVMRRWRSERMLLGETGLPLVPPGNLNYASPYIPLRHVRAYQYAIHDLIRRFLRITSLCRINATIIGPGDLVELGYFTGDILAVDSRMLHIPDGASITFLNRRETLRSMLERARTEAGALVAMNSIYMDSDAMINEVKDSILDILDVMNNEHDSIRVFIFSVYAGARQAVNYPFNSIFGRTEDVGRFSYGNYEPAPYLIDFDIHERSQLENLTIYVPTVTTSNVIPLLRSQGAQITGEFSAAMLQIRAVVATYVVVKGEV